MSGSLPSSSSLTTALSNLAASPTFYIQSDWENVLREFNTARTQGGGAVDRLGKESKQFWFSLQKMGTDGIESTATLSASPQGVEPTAATSLTAAAKSVQAESTAKGFEVKFMNPLQLLAYNADASLTQLIQAPRSTFNSLHPASVDVFSLDINPAGNLAISGAAEGTLRTWDPNTGNPLKDLKGHEGDVTFVRMFPSGSVALSAGLDLGMKVWALDSGLVAAKLNGHTRPVTNVRFIDRGRHLVSSSEDGTAKLWDVSVQQAITSYPAHPDAFPPKINDCLLLDPTQRAAIPEAATNNTATSSNFPSSLSSNLLITGGADGILRGFDLRSPVQSFMIPLPASSHAGGIERLAHGPKEASVTLGTSEGVIAVLDLRSKGALYAMRQDDAAITNLRPWSENSFWSTSSTGQVSLWKLDDASDSATTAGSGRIVAQLSGVDCEPVHDICFTPSNNMAFVSSHGAVRAYMLSSFLSAASSEEVKAFHDFALPTPKSK